MLVRVTTMVLRICALLALILGLLFWFNLAGGGLVPVHMLLGILVALSLIILGVAIGTTKGGTWGLGIGAIILSIIMVALGLSQGNLLPENHWIIQVLHLLVGICAIGLGEAIGGRYRRINVKA
jgi:hypothetical protein